MNRVGHSKPPPNMIAFAYYGAKNGLLPALLPLLPECDHYCEPFCGSATVLLNRPASPIESINDLNGDIVNFFRVLREQGEKLVMALELTPYSFEEFKNSWKHSDCPVERARRLYIRTQMDFAKAGRSADKSWSVNKTYTKGSHSSSVKNFHNKVQGMYEVIERLKNVQIDNRNALDFINKFDSPATLFYCDPPYLSKTRSQPSIYKFEMNIDEHIALAKLLNDVKGRVALSGYDHPIMNEIYPGWHKHTFKSRRVPMSNGNGLVRQECLWTNYDPYKYGKQNTFFD